MKLSLRAADASRTGRPFTGAWIETRWHQMRCSHAECRPFTGAWIETIKSHFYDLLGESPLHGGVD